MRRCSGASVDYASTAEKRGQYEPDNDAPIAGHLSVDYLDHGGWRRFRFQGYEKVRNAGGNVRMVMQEWICEALAVMGPEPDVGHVILLSGMKPQSPEFP